MFVEKKVQNVTSKNRIRYKNDIFLYNGQFVFRFFYKLQVVAILITVNLIHDTPYIRELLFFQHDVDDNDYYTNGAGYHHSHKYGFGLLDSWRLVNTAKV